MNDFKSMAKTGSDFAIILFETDDAVDNTVIEVTLDGMKMKTILCNDSDTSVTLQPLAEGNYEYKVTEICGGSVRTSSGEFSIGEVHEAYFLKQVSMGSPVKTDNEYCFKWKLNPNYFECISIGMKDKRGLIQEIKLDPSIDQYSIPEPKEWITVYFAFLLKNGQYVEKQFTYNTSGYRNWVQDNTNPVYQVHCVNMPQGHSVSFGR